MTTNMSRADALTDDKRQALGEALTEYFAELDRGIGIDTPDRILSLFDYHDSRNVDDLIDRAIAPTIAASHVDQPAPVTAQMALAAIDTFELVGENNDAREPNADDRFILIEFIAHAFGGYPVELATAAADPRTLTIDDVRTARETARQVFQGECSHTFDAIEYVTSLLEATDAARSCVASRASQTAVHAGTAPAALTAAARDVLAERRRQVEQEGWTPAHDDQHGDHQMSCAAGCYAMYTLAYPAGDPPPSWPWSPDWWKPTTHRRNLVKAGALIQAAIERLDRAGDPK
ncbi:hypothetical protein [Burkholderia sp. BCC1630]|uniref:hypothetical protein n=1 Tax=Burkholderia sp. BCC1630 TaxID=2676304 RepID=UPI001FC7D69B|nr:hypothetical protein [Burkholderia sp. BCC1630]